jgi:hypothetical protein
LAIDENGWSRLYEIEKLLKVSNKFINKKYINVYLHLYLFRILQKQQNQCGETYPTLSYAISIYNILLNKMERFYDSPDFCIENKVNFYL